jgi:hypothetical protein
MSRIPRHLTQPDFDRLETRLTLSLSPSTNTFGLTPPANAIGISPGDIATAGAIGSTTVTIAPRNITPNKASTEFALFVQPESGSGVLPRIVGVEQNGKILPVQFGRPYSPRNGGKSTNQAVAFFETGQSGPVTVLVAGQKHTTGSYTVETTLPGDINGDGQVNLADLVPFANAFGSKPGWPNYNAAADFNQNGIINLYDAKAVERNMPPLAPNGPLNAAINLAPSDQADYAAPKNSGGSTMKRDVQIDGYTMPGSIVLEIRLSNLKTPDKAIATDAKGFFTVSSTNDQGVNTTNFLIIDPYGGQLVRSYPVFWIPFAAPHSKYQPKSTS